MRIIFLFIACLVFLPIQANAKSAMDTCFEYYRDKQEQLFECMNIKYEKREAIRVMIEEDIISIVKMHSNKNYSPSGKKRDVESLNKGREMFEAYRKIECDRQKVFLARNGAQATFEHMACLFDMTKQRIHTLQTSVNE